MQDLKFEITCSSDLLNIKMPLTKLPINTILHYEVPFTIFINNHIFFQDQYFPILEFLLSVRTWINDDADINYFYHTLESDENPLLSFITHNSLWKIVSTWQEFNCPFILKKKDIVEEIISIMEVLNIRI